MRTFSLHIVPSTYSSLMCFFNCNHLQYKNTQVCVHVLCSSRILTTAIQISSVVNGKPEIPGSNYMIFPTVENYTATDKSQMRHRLMGSYKNGEKQSPEEIRGHTVNG